MSKEIKIDFDKLNKKKIVPKEKKTDSVNLKVSNEIIKCQKDINCIKEDLDKLSSNCSPCEQRRLCSNVLEKLFKIQRILSRKLKEIPNISGEEQNYVGNLDISYDSVKDLVTLKLNHILPRKPRFDFITQKMIGMYDFQSYFSYYNKVTNDFIKNNEAPFYKERCVLTITSYYNKNSSFLDHDNMDYKYFIDAAIKPFLIDDSPLLLDVNLRAKIEEDESKGEYTIATLKVSKK